MRVFSAWLECLPERTGLPGGEVYSALSGPTDWILRYYKNMPLPCRLHNLVTNRQQDKQNLAALERKLLEERKQKANIDQLLISERKAKKAEEAIAARAVALASATRSVGYCGLPNVCQVAVHDVASEVKYLLKMIISTFFLRKANFNVLFSGNIHLLYIITYRKKLHFNFAPL